MHKKLRNVKAVPKERAEEIARFLFALGNQFLGVKNLGGAFDCFKYSMDLDNKMQQSVHNLGVCFYMQGNYLSAERMLREARRMSPRDLETRSALADCCRRLGKLEECIEIVTQIQKENPEWASLDAVMSLSFHDSGQLEKALHHNSRVLLKNPDDEHAALNEGLIHMLFGEWPEWWARYEECLSYKRNDKMRALKRADSWQGQECEGKVLIVVSDQGSGDAIQFSRYLLKAKRLGKFEKLIFLVQPDLVELMRRVPGVDQVIAFGEKDNVDYDYFSSLLGVMRVLQVSPETAMAQPHIVTDFALNLSWKAKVDSLWDGKSKKVGLVWAGDPKHGNDHARSVKLEELLGHLCDVRGVQFFSVQAGKGLDQLTDEIATKWAKYRGDVGQDSDQRLSELGSDFRTFDDTASALKQLDLLISVDTSVAHLGGSLGTPTWVLLPNPPEWRWLLPNYLGLGPKANPWYPSVALYRQEKPRGWSTVFEEVAKDLAEFAKL